MATVTTYLDCGCAILEGGGRIWCPTHEAEMERSFLPHEEMCQHGVAWNTHCCNCHTGFLFDNISHVRGCIIRKIAADTPLTETIRSAYSYAVGRHMKGEQICAYIEARIKPFLHQVQDALAEARDALQDSMVQDETWDDLPRKLGNYNYLGLKERIEAALSGYGEEAP